MAHRDLRPGIVAAFIEAAADTPGRSQVMVALARMEGASPQRQGVKEDLLVRLLQPAWHRILLNLWVRLRRSPG